MAKSTVAATTDTPATDTTVGAALKKALQKSNKITAARPNNDARQPMTLERARALAPHLGLMENIAGTFPLLSMSRENAQEFYAHIRETTEEQIVSHGDSLSVVLSEQALKMHLERLVGAYVGSAIGAGTYYQSRVTIMRDMHSKLTNDARDEDRGAPVGFESKAERARQFAAETAAQAFAMLAAAEGAVHAYAHLTGDEWKPYVSNNQQPVSKQAADAQLAAFGG